MSEYAFQGYVYGQKECWADAYPRLGDARRAAKQWVAGKPSRTADLLVAEPKRGDFGVTWKVVGEVKWTT